VVEASVFPAALSVGAWSISFVSIESSSSMAEEEIGVQDSASAATHGVGAHQSGVSPGLLAREPQQLHSNRMREYLAMMTVDV
jgi:hypothetical protein